MFDDEITVIEVQSDDIVVEEAQLIVDEHEVIEPPPLPFPLRRNKSSEQDAWLASLPARTRAVLEAARTTAPLWPIARRVPGAVAQPLRRNRTP